jgi:hypothetical protein
VILGFRACGDVSCLIARQLVRPLPALYSPSLFEVIFAETGEIGFFPFNPVAGVVTIGDVTLLDGELRT